MNLYIPKEESSVTQDGYIVGEPMLSCANVHDTFYWARSYLRNTKFPVNILKRFAIGIYQIHQGMGWQDRGLNKFESYAAAALHFTMVSEQVNSGSLAVNFDEMKMCKLGEGKTLDSETLLFHISRAQQHLVYSDQGNRTKRSGRYSEEKLLQSLFLIIRVLMQSIPNDLIEEAFITASTIMTKELK